MDIQEPSKKGVGAGIHARIRSNPILVDISLATERGDLMQPEDNPRDEQQSFPCECGGSITLVDGKWQCNICNTCPGEDK